MNDGVIGIVFSWVYVSLKEFGVVGSDTYTWGIKDFHKRWSGSLAKRRLPRACRCNKLHSTICTVLLSEFVSRNAWLQQLILKKNQTDRWEPSNRLVLCFRVLVWSRSCTTFCLLFHPSFNLC